MTPTPTLSTRAAAVDDVLTYANETTRTMPDDARRIAVLHFALHYMRPLIAGRSAEDDRLTALGVYDALEELGIIGPREVRP